ncbi:MAG: peptide chain release factor 1, partial [Firmicutes bacterium]|nr:peptide chain release factor 1 [Bacillota bacterium]
KSQIKNKAKGMRVLRARVLEKMRQEAADAEASARRSMVGSGDRSERIRTYNFPERRVTDHRIGLTLHKLDQILEGQLDEIIDALITSDQAARLKE